VKDYYAVLGISREAHAREIKRAYKKSVKKWHPDLHPDDPVFRIKMQEINEAYEVLGNPPKRRAYDRRIEEERNSGVQASRFHTGDPEHPFFSYFLKMNEILRKRTQK
jgi:curved DNA-binding protein CbpA